MVDANRIKGQFVLTGSHQPELGAAVSESLAGRTGICTLMPLSIEELKEGDVLTVHDLLLCMLVSSANNAAVALAIHVAGSESAFVELMNQEMI